MKFRTEIKIDNPRGLTLDPTVPVALAGSCFTDNIASRMRRCCWHAVNPFGALYNPESIAKVIGMALDIDHTPLHPSCFEAAGVWHSWLLDTKFAAASPEGIATNFRQAAGAFRNAVELSGSLCVTFGTAWVYRLQAAAGFTVANCHRRPAGMFSRTRLDVQEISDMWLPLIDSLAARYPGLRILFTVSPVRHLKDGFEGNSRSKAILQLAVERIVALRENCHYFPAYEIMTDDLRDYRYYADDLVHPSTAAVEYIWECFTEAYVPPAARDFLTEGARLNAALSHRPLLEGIPAADAAETTRLARLEAECRDFLDRYPHAFVKRPEKRTVR